ncbi:MAG: type II toxin-antitoxin system RelB/DinJ family antitoxin [Clostridiales bacterium]|jgi:DNA-damage-inducible protein J|nr:type II toxin-antitoxin system RelB/DinJ family antitoxin [Clostridiales bacterium]
MAKTDTVYMRIDPNLKANAESILSRLGLTPNEAINIFLNQVVLQRGLPFSIKIPPQTKEEAEAALFERIREAEESFANEPHLTIGELKARLGI